MSTHSSPAPEAAQDRARARGRLPFWLQRETDCRWLVQAPDKPSLFARSASALFFRIADMSGVRDADRTLLAVQGEDVSSLLTAWLAELDTLRSDRRMLFKRFAILEMSNTYLKAEACGEDFDPARHALHDTCRNAAPARAVAKYVNDRWIARLEFDGMVAAAAGSETV